MGKKRFFSVIVYVVYLLSFFIIADYCFYRALAHRIPKSAYDRKKALPPASAELTSQIMSRLGFVQTDKASSFARFDVKKKKGVVRIGCFGDSYTYGDEVGPAGDFPDLLQEILAKNGYDNYEVINFGASWYGFCQAFMMWKYVGQTYGLDIVLFGPQCLDFFERNLSFNHGWRDSSGRIYDYLHARYILKDGALQLIDLLGNTQQERVRNYFRFLTPLRYVRYDYNAPAFLSCLIIDQKLRLEKNPFYYYNGSPEDESGQIYRLCFDEMGASGANVLLFHSRKAFRDIVSGLHKDNVRARAFYDPPKHFPYRMPQGHCSMFGNQLIALQMFASLTDSGQSRFDIMETADIEKELSQGIVIKRRNIFEYKDIKVELEGMDIGCFENVDADRFAELKKPALKGRAIVSLLAVKKKGESILDGVFVPLYFPLSEGMPLELSFMGARAEVRMPLGAVRMLNPGFGLGVVELNDAVTDKGRIQIRPGRAVGKHEQATIILDGKPVLACVRTRAKDGVLFFYPTRGDLLAIRPSPDSFIDIGRLAGSGIVYLALTGVDGESVKLPCARWNKIGRDMP